MNFVALPNVFKYILERRVAKVLIWPEVRSSTKYFWEIKENNA